MNLKIFNSKLRIFAAAVFVVSISTIIAITDKQVEHDYQTKIAEAQNDTRLLAVAFAEHAQSTVRLIDGALDLLAQEWAIGPEGFIKEANQWTNSLQDLAVQFGAVYPNGDVAYSNLGVPGPPINLSDREHIRVHLDGTHTGLFVSKPVLGRVSKRWSIQFSRVSKIDGEIKGVIVVSLDADYFRKFYEKLPLSPGSVILIVRDSGEVLARVSEGDNAPFIGQMASATRRRLHEGPSTGNYSLVSEFDGIERIHGYSRMPAIGWSVVTAISLEEALAPHYAERHSAMLTAISIGICICLLTITFVTRVESEGARARALKETNLELEARIKARTQALEDSNQATKSANRFLNDILTSSPVIHIKLDIRTYDVTFISDNVFEMLGWRPDDFAKTPSLWRDCIHEDDRASVFKNKGERLGVGPNFSRFRFRQRNGNFVWMSYAFQSSDTSGGTPSEFIGAFWKIDERVAIEDKLREVQKLEAIGQLTGGLSHDFNNLLGIVVGNLDRMGERLGSDGELRDAHAVALDAALRGASITRSLLAVARRQPMEIKRHDLNAIITQLLPLARSSAGSDVALDVGLAQGEMPADVDAGGLSNTVLNLVINARDALAGRQGLKKIALRARRETVESQGLNGLAPGQYAVIEVADNGSGMTDSTRQRALEPFFTTKERGKGTGLGLSMAYGFATQLGGTVEIKSSIGAGTTISLWLPLKAELEGDSPAVPDCPTSPTLQASPAATQQTAGPGEDRGASQRRRALIVDDEKDLCRLACNWIGSLGFETVGVHSAADAIETLSKHHFDLLFTDVMMPGQMDGLELAVKSAADFPNLRIVVASGYAGILLDRKELPGVLLSKPYRKNDLVATISAIEWPTGKDQNARMT